ncbi:MAG: hypothetical protein KIS67_14610 [Verrucomicrobiae bacterium]|nr:hypothetical protein [Verrucomicrobiae bacterium]
MTNVSQIQDCLPATVLRRRAGRFNWLIPESFRDARWLDQLEQPALLLQPPAQPLKPATMLRREVVRVRLDDTTTGEVVVKRFAPHGFVKTIKWSLRVAPALRAFHLARQIATLGFLTPATIAAGERRVWGLLRESFLLTRFIAGANPLHQVNATCTDRQRRVGIVCGLARLYAALHDEGFFHHDPSQSNFLVVPQPDGRDAIALIDLDGLRRRRKMNLSNSVRDLQRLLRRGRIPRRERAWFIVSYARSRKPTVSARRLVRLIGPAPAQATFPHCALDDNSLPETTS